MSVALMGKVIVGDRLCGNGDRRMLLSAYPQCHEQGHGSALRGPGSLLVD